MIKYNKSNLPLNKVQDASMNMSVEWKKQSKVLLDEAYNNQNMDAFKAAVIWCGTYGNVIRTVSSNDMLQFAKDLYNNISNIKNGTYSLSQVNVYGKNQPKSYVSKICHIINPQQYPFIYDSKTKKRFKKNSINAWDGFILTERNDSKNEPTADLYEQDSRVWASL